MRLDFAFDSFVGRRDENQDATLQIRVSDRILLLGVADGMGGVRGGKMASQLTVSAIETYIRSLNPGDFKEGSLKKILEQCYVHANKAIAEAVDERPEYRGMGSTLCLLMIYHDKYVWANIGDSRIYLVGKEDIRLLTTDHTYLQEHYGNQEGEIPAAVKKQYEHYLTKNLDGNSEKPDLFPASEPYAKLKTGEFFLLCSDGLILDKMGRDYGPFHTIVKNSGSVRMAVKRLIEYAFKSGSRDNIAVSLLSVQGEFNFTSQEVLSSKFSRVSMYVMLILALGMSVFFFYQTLSVGSPNSLIIDNASVMGTSRNGDIKFAWKPLKQFDYESPLQPGYHIYWLAYPDIERVKSYQLIVKSGEDVVEDRQISATDRKIQVSELNLVMDSQYLLQVNVVLEDESVVEGNTVRIKVGGSGE